MAIIARYYLTCQGGNCRQFCRTCSNSFTISSCGAQRCIVPTPAVICLNPMIPISICEQMTECTGSLGLVVKDFYIDPTFPDWEFLGSDNVEAALNIYKSDGFNIADDAHNLWDGDWVLSASPDPCKWIGERSLIYTYPPDEVALCGNCYSAGGIIITPCKSVITCYVEAKLDTCGFDELCWFIEYRIGFESYSVVPPFLGGDCPSEHGVKLSEESWIRCTAPVLHQDPIICNGEFGVEDWQSILSAPYIIIAPLSGVE